MSADLQAPTPIHPFGEPQADLASTRQELASVRAALQTERSAARALLDAVTELEDRLVKERDAHAFQRDQNSQLWGELEILHNEHAMELSRPRWRRVLER